MARHSLSEAVSGGAYAGLEDSWQASAGPVGSPVRRPELFQRTWVGGAPMQGRISVLGSAAFFGIIKADNGLSVRFQHSAVAPYDLAGLVVDQRVSFDIENGQNPQAINVRLRRDTSANMAAPSESSREPVRLRYMGFEQNGAAREYKFDRVMAGGDAARVLVRIAMSLFNAHHLSIQDGPALCLRILNAPPRDPDAMGSLEVSMAVTDADVQVYLQSKLAAAQAGSARGRQSRARGASTASPTE
jgi:cold shock CspA family protein